MISLSENATALINLKGTIEAVRRLDMLIETYSKDLPGPAYTSFSPVGSTPIEVQFDRPIAVTALKAQRALLTDYLAGLGIDANS